jgi:hypothetical protein
MRGSPLRPIASMGLVLGAVLGLVGTLVPSESLRGLLWGIDGTALVLATASLTVHHLRRGNDLMAAGFLVFALGQGLVLSTAAMELVESKPLFGAGAALWACGLGLVSASAALPLLLRVLGTIAAVLFAGVAGHVFLGHLLTPLSRPLPFFAYPFLVVTLLGWAWVHHREGLHDPPPVAR